jgi:Histidine kinase
MIWPFQNKVLASYWLKVFALYALTEACIQLLFLFILNNYGDRKITLIEFHIVMWIFQCVLIWPIWWLAWSVKHKNVVVQIVFNVAFYVVYSLLWFGPVQDAIGFFYNELQHFTRAKTEQLSPMLDSGTDSSYLSYQLLKHSFRLSWYFLAAYFYNYRVEEKKRMELAVANRELQLKLLKWHLNPSFYFKTINHLRKVATALPQHATLPILQLAKVMEYVIYEAKEKLIDVKKEIQFITNYIELINQQPDNQVTFVLAVKGEYDTLKIAPLLLVGFIDNVTAFTNGEGKQLYKMELQFSSNYMQMMMGTMNGKAVPNFPLPDSELFKRISELYPQKFEINAPCNRDGLKLSLRLDEQ